MLRIRFFLLLHLLLFYFQANATDTFYCDSARYVQDGETFTGSNCNNDSVRWYWSTEHSMAPDEAIMAYDEEGTLRPICAVESRAPGNRGQGELLGLKVIDRDFADESHYGQCQTIGEDSTYQTGNILLTRDFHRCSAMSWVSSSESLALDRDTLFAGTVENSGIQGSEDACLCESYFSPNLRDESGQLIASLGSVLADGSQQPCRNNQCRPSNGTAREALNFLSSSQCTDHAERANMFSGPLHSFELSTRKVMLDPGSSALEAIRILGANDNWQPSESIRPCIGASTSGRFNLGTLVSRLVIDTTGGTKVFSGGCLYSNTAGTRAFYDRNYLDLQLPNKLTEFQATSAISETNSVWDQALFAGRKPGRGVQEKLYICLVRENSKTYYGRKLRGQGDCYYSRVELFPNDGAGVRFVPARSEHFSLLTVQTEVKKDDGKEGEKAQEVDKAGQHANSSVSPVASIPVLLVLLAVKLVAF